MPGSWLAVVKGFAGMQISKDMLLRFSPVLPKKWKSYTFKVNYQGNTLQISVGKAIKISLTSGDKLSIQVYQNTYMLKRGTPLSVPIAVG